jgi:hypothetical protein
MCYNPVTVITKLVRGHGVYDKRNNKTYLIRNKTRKNISTHFIWLKELFIYVFVIYLTELSVPQTIDSSGWIIVNDELQRMWKETVVASFKVQFRHFPGGTDENHEKSQSAVCSVSRPRFEFCASGIQDRNFAVWVNLPGNSYSLKCSNTN